VMERLLLGLDLVSLEGVSSRLSDAAWRGLKTERHDHMHMIPSKQKLR